MQPFLALIQPLSQPGGEPPLGIWGGGNVPFPTPPIHLPPGIWGPNDPRPTPPIYIPGYPPLQIWGPNDPRPTPPIYIPGWPPLTIWGGGNVPMPSPPIANVPGAPGYQPPGGIWGGGGVPMPNPPIANVPGAPGYQPPGGIWGPNDPRPTHPIVLPLPPGSQLPPNAPPEPTIPPEAGNLQPPADVPGEGMVWMLGYFPGGLEWRWVAVDAGTASRAASTPGQPGAQAQPPKR